MEQPPTLLDLLPEGVRDIPLFSLSALDLLKQVQERNLDDNFWREKLRLDFPDKPIIDQDNLNLVYWYYVYRRTKEEINKIFERNADLTREARSQGLTSKVILELINKLSASAQELIPLEELEKKLPIHIFSLRSKKYGSWPICYDSKDDLSQGRDLEIRFAGGGKYLVKLDDKYQDLKDVDLSLYQGKFLIDDKGLILAYIYLEPSLETLLNFTYSGGGGGTGYTITQNIQIPAYANTVTVTLFGGGGGC